MRICFILFIIFHLVACQSKQEHKAILSDSTSSKNSLKEEYKDTLQATSELEGCDFGDGLFDFEEDLTKESLTQNVTYDWVNECEAINIFQKVKNDIIGMKALAKNLGLTEEQLIIEHKTLKDFPNRAIIIWGEDIKVGFDLCDVYTCSQTTSGTGCFRGSIRVSLLDIENNSIINTIEIYEPYWGDKGSDCFTVPFSIANKKYKFVIGGLKYHTIGGDSIKDGRADVLHFDDYIGSGKKLEFALYHQEGCVTCLSTLFGYDEKVDSLINYNVVLEETDLDSVKKKAITTKYRWVSEMFTMRPKDGMYSYLKDNRARGGRLHYYKATFNKEKKQFEGTLKSTSKENDTLGMSWITYPIQQ